MMAALSPKVLLETSSRRSELIRLLHCTPALCNRRPAPVAKKPVKKDAQGFRVYKIEGLNAEEVEVRRKFRIKPLPPPRWRRMAEDQDWTDVWPTEQTFNWSIVPFPVRQGYIKNLVENQGVVPTGYGNLELMKPPNFLHLTPPHIKKHCAALKKFCTQWPEGLDDEACEQMFPLTSTTSDYVFSGPSLEDTRARTASIQIKVDDLKLPKRARVKLVKLCGDRYNAETGVLTLESDRCPLKTQNLDYVRFLLTAVYFESLKYEPWEANMALEDQDQYYWHLNPSRSSALAVISRIQEVDSLPYIDESVTDEEALCQVKEVSEYAEAVTRLHNTGENPDTLHAYKQSVLNLLNLQSEHAV